MAADNEAVTSGQAEAMSASGLDISNARHGWRIIQHADGSKDSVFWKAPADQELDAVSLSNEIKQI